jgi:predicted O-linked N-acetylglucosamine transferase (SPINDLY family)
MIIMNDRQSIENQFAQAKHLHQNQLFDEAEKIYRQLLPMAPKWAEIHHLLGVLLGQKGQPEVAVPQILRAIELLPTVPHYYHNLGRLYLTILKWTDALAAFKFAIKLAPNYPEAWFGKGNALKGQGNLSGAIQAYQKALKIKPGYPEVHYNLGNTWLEMGHMRSAREAFEQCLRLQPDNAQAHNNLASTLEYWEQYDLAEGHYLTAMNLAPNFPDPRSNLGALYEKQGRSELCRQQLTGVLEKFADIPALPWIRWHKNQISEIIWLDSRQMARHREDLEKQILSLFHQPPQLVLSDLHRLSIQPPFDLAYQGLDDLALKKTYAQFFDRYFVKIRKELGTNVPRRLSTGRRKVGFVVTQGHEGVFLKCMQGMLRQLDSSKMEITVVCQAPNGQAILQPSINRSDIQYFAIANRLDLAIRQLHEAQFDILHFWEVGTDALNYFLPFFRLAPVQCTSWGWPVTSGISAMDYFLSCERLETGDSDSHYSEKLIRFKRLPVYYYRPAVPAVTRDRTTMGLPPDKRLYLCAQNLRKVHPDMDMMLQGILETDPQALILLLEDKQKGITEKLQNRFRLVFPHLADRCVFLPRMSEEDYLNLLCLVEVILDTPHYTGGANTAYDAFATGTPYTTLPGQFHRGRYGSAAYQQLGVTELIAGNPADYVAKAVRVANDAPYREALKTRILAGQQCIFEDIVAVRELEEFLLTVQSPLAIM